MKKLSMILLVLVLVSAAMVSCTSSRKAGCKGVPRMVGY